MPGAGDTGSRHTLTLDRLSLLLNPLWRKHAQSRNSERGGEHCGHGQGPGPEQRASRSERRAASAGGEGDVGAEGLAVFSGGWIEIRARCQGSNSQFKPRPLGCGKAGSWFPSKVQLHLPAPRLAPAAPPELPPQLRVPLALLASLSALLWAFTFLQGRSSF